MHVFFKCYFLQYLYNNWFAFVCKWKNQNLFHEIQRLEGKSRFWDNFYYNYSIFHEISYQCYCKHLFESDRNIGVKNLPRICWFTIVILHLDRACGYLTYDQTLHLKEYFVKSLSCEIVNCYLYFLLCEIN